MATDHLHSFNDPSGFMAAYQQNASCNPITSRDSPCLQGNYVEYAIEVHEASDVVAGVTFAQDRNVRLVIKNTGHEYVRARSNIYKSKSLQLLREEYWQRRPELVDAQTQEHRACQPY